MARQPHRRTLAAERRVIRQLQEAIRNADALVPPDVTPLQPQLLLDSTEADTMEAIPLTGQAATTTDVNTAIDIEGHESESSA
jgi:hypothetical protein